MKYNQLLKIGVENPEKLREIIFKVGMEILTSDPDKFLSIASSMSPKTRLQKFYEENKNELSKTKKIVNLRQTTFWGLMECKYAVEMIFDGHSHVNISSPRSEVFQEVVDFIESL